MKKAGWLLGIGLALGLSLTALARTSTAIIVTTTTDELNSDGDCSLREAIRAANLDQAVDACPAGNGTDTINLPAGVYSLTIPGRSENATLTGDLDIVSPLMLVGAGAANTFIDAGGVPGIDRVFHVFAFTVQISHLTIRGGDATVGSGNELDGGGLYLEGGWLTLTNSRVEENTAYGFGGGLYNNGGQLTLRQTIVFNNTANTDGGGLNNYLGITTLDTSAVTGNYALQNNVDGLLNVNGVLTLTNSTISDNDGEGLYNLDTGQMTIVGSTLSGNMASGLVVNGAGHVAITNSTISGNYTAIYITGTATVTLTNVTVNYSEGVPNYLFNYIGPVRLKNTIIGSSCSGPFISLGHNLENGNTCGLTATGDLINTNPALGSLMNNGGSTFTHALGILSPARDAGDNVGCPVVDQRGYLRDANCDMGAFEYGATTPTPTATSTPGGPTPTPTSTSTPAGPTPTPGAVLLPVLMRNWANCFIGPNEVEDNNSSGQANGPLCSAQDYFGYHNDASDYFAFTLPTNGNIVATLTTTASDVQLLLYLGNVLVAQDADSPYALTCPPGPQGNCSGAAGPYYVRVFTGPTAIGHPAPYTVRVTYP